MTKGRAGDAVAAAASIKVPCVVVIEDIQPSKVLSSHRPNFAAVEQNRPDQGLLHAAFGRERNLSPGPSCSFRAGIGTDRYIAWDPFF